MLKGILKSDCNPIVLSILVTNDNTAKPKSDSEEVIGMQPVQGGAEKQPALDAEKSCSILKTELEACGIMVVPVINRPKEYFKAILMVLANQGVAIPKSCEFLWFIFTGHGAGGKFCMNGKHMYFEELISEASLIKLKYMAFFFECCQLRSNDRIQAPEIMKQYIAVYSSPPNKVSYHHKGVGLMVTCLAEMLKDGYNKSFTELQRELRQRLVMKITDVMEIPLEQHELFISHHLPHQTATLYDDFSFYTKTCAASE